MTRHPFRQFLRALPVAAAVIFVAPLAAPTAVDAQSVDQQRQKVEDIVDELERLEEKATALAENYVGAIDTKQQLDAEIVDAEARIAEQEVELGKLRSSLSDMALRSFVGGGAAPLGPLFEDSTNLNDAVRREELARVALSAGDATTDELDALVAEINAERNSLDRKRQQAEDLAATLTASQADTLKKTEEYTKARADAEAKLGSLIQEEEARRAAESARRLAEEAAASQARANANANAGNSNSGSNSGSNGNNSSSSNAAPDPAGDATSAAPSSGGGSGGSSGGGHGHVPNVSSRSGLAIQAAMAQQGVPYRFAASSPGVAFDCSGLTAYAWGQAGVGLPHQSRAQYASVPHVPKDQAQPGDLLFFYSPISHVSIYLGNGTQVHAPSTGKTVSTAAVNWGKVTGVGRPG